MIETRFKDTEVGRIPEDWKVKSIKDFTDIITGATPSRSIPTYWNGGSIRWMSSGELNNKFIFDVEGRITQLGYNNTGTHMLPKHCVLIGLAGQGKTRGTAAYNHVELCTNQSIAAVLPDKDNFDSLYLYYFVDSQYKWKSHATLTLLARQDLPILGTVYLTLVKSWCRGSILFYPFRYSSFSWPLIYACFHRIILWYVPYE